MKGILHKHRVSFRHAIDGVLWAVKSQPNFRIHLVLSTCAIFAGVMLGISRIEYLIILFTILLGLTVEMLNTAIESVTDLVTTEWKMSAKTAKDVAAGMMLIVAFGAVCVAILIFSPYVYRLISG